MIQRRRLIVTALEIFLLHSILFGAAVFWGGTLVPVNAGGRLGHTFLNPFVRGLQTWDAGWYLAIVTHGYNRLSIVFFPLFPLLIRAVSRLLAIGALPAGLAVANLSFLAAIYLFLRLLDTEGVPDETAYRAALYLALFPTSFFFSTVYTESLFLALSLGAFLCARNSRWAAAGLLAGLTALTRNPGIILLPALAWEYLAQKKERGRLWDRQVLYLGLIPLLLVPFLIYQQFRFGGPLAFMHAQSLTEWNRQLTVPGWPVVLDFLRMIPPRFVYWWTTLLDDLLFTLGALFLLILGSRRLRRSWLLYAAASVLMPLCSYIPGEPLTSMPRYVIVLFPLYLVLAEKASHPRVQLFLQVMFPAFFLLFAVLYVNGYWIA